LLAEGELVAQVPRVSGGGSGVSGAGSKTGAKPAPQIGLLRYCGGASSEAKMGPAPFT